MSVKLKERLGQERIKRWGLYCVKAIALVIILLLFSKTAPSMTPIGVALFWAILSAVIAIGFEYHYVVRKVYRQYMYKSGGHLARINSGRFFSLLISFFLSAIMVAGLIFESPKWEFNEWLIIVIAIPLYVLVYAVVKRFLAKELEPLFQQSKTIAYSCGITGFLLCVIYLVVNAIEPSTQYANILVVFINTKRPFEGSPSMLLAESGKILALVDCYTTYGVMELANVSKLGYLICKIAICGATFFGIASMLGVCVLDKGELKLAFLPIDAIKDPSANKRIVKRFAVIAVVFPIILITGFLFAESKVPEITSSQGYASIKSSVDEFVYMSLGDSVDEADGKYYDDIKVQSLNENAKTASEKVERNREEVLTPLIKEDYEKRKNNVDKYLDWYYNIAPDLERFVGSLVNDKEYMRDQFMQRINEGVDDFEFEGEFSNCNRKSMALISIYNFLLQHYEIQGIDDDLIESIAKYAKHLDTDSLTMPVVRLNAFIKVCEHSRLSVGVLVPADLILLKVDEALNRENYRTEIMNALDDAEKQTLALVSAEPSGFSDAAAKLSYVSTICKQAQASSW